MFRVLKRREAELKSNSGVLNVVSGGVNPEFSDLEARQKWPLCFTCLSNRIQKHICVSGVLHTQRRRGGSQSPERGRSRTHASLPTLRVDIGVVTDPISVLFHTNAV